MKRLRVLHLDSGVSWRGGQRQVLLLALGLRDRGHEPFLIGSPGSPLVQRARAAGLAVASIRMRADWDVAAARRIRARMRTWSVDMVHAHDARSHALALMAVLGKPEIPLIVTRRVPFPPRSVRLKYGERVTRFIAISNAVRDAMVTGGIAGGRITVVHSGIVPHEGPVLPRDWRTELKLPSDAVMCGIVGAMTPEKGIDMIAAIAESLPARVRDRAKLILVGGAAAQAGTVGGLEIHRIGFVADIDPAVAGLDVLWHPSRAEGLGTVVMDAMSLGVPPVAFSVGGLPEVIEHEVSGLLVPAADARAFAAQAARLIEDETLRRRIAEGARLRAQTFDASVMTKETEAVYNHVLSG